MQTALLTSHAPSSGYTHWLAEAAVSALIDEVDLPGKPGLVGPDGARGHCDMDIDLMRSSACALRGTYRDLAVLGTDMPVSQELRDQLGLRGRRGESTMMKVTGGVNTHRGAIWNLGLLVTAVAGLGPGAERSDTYVLDVTERAGRIAAIRDSATDTGNRPGAVARRRYRVGGAVSEASGGFPHVRGVVTALRDHRYLGRDDSRLTGLLTSMSSLDDTCLLHRGGADGLALVRTEASRILAKTVLTGHLDREQVKRLDMTLIKRGLSPGGSADLLACGLFLEKIGGA